MPQTYAKLGQSLGDMLGGFASGNEDAYNKGAVARSTLDMHRASATKNLEEAKRLQQFNDPAQVKKLAMAMAGGNESQLPGLDTFQKTGGVGEAVFQQPNADLEMIRPKPVMLSDPANLSQPNSLGDDLMQHSAPQGRSLPLAVPDTIRDASRLAAFVQAGGEKMATPEFFRQMRDDPAIKAAALSGNTDLLNRLNAALTGHTYTPNDYNSDGTVINKASGDVTVGNEPINTASLGKLLADAMQSKAAAANSTASAEKHRFDINNPQAKKDRFSSVRDDIRADFNAMYPISSLNGKRPPNTPDFDGFTQIWLKKFNINETDYFNNTSPGAAPQSDAAPATASPPKPVSPPPTNAKGWTLHTDAKGNRAYVSPDRKQFEEVK